MTWERETIMKTTSNQSVARGNRLRQESLARRDQLTDVERREKSEKIGAALLALEEMRTSSNIFIYISFRSEVETMPIVTALLQQGKNVSVPLTRVSEKRLDIVAIEDPERELTAGYCNIPEPRESIAASRTVAPETLDLIILPGSVFDQRGGRFGYGGGYYDRLLARIPSAYRCALAFEVQLVNELPLQDHDQLLDCIVTEDRVILTPSRR